MAVSVSKKTVTYYDSLKITDLSEKKYEIYFEAMQ